MGDVVDLGARRGCVHEYEDVEVFGGIEAKVCRKCSIGYTTDAEPDLGQLLSMISNLRDELERRGLSEDQIDAVQKAGQVQSPDEDQ